MSSGLVGGDAVICVVLRPAVTLFATEKNRLPPPPPLPPHDADADEEEKEEEEDD